eukprot:Sspe_Gene.64581::Locus_38266_Transcript_1_2_Confidence_0.667_Length_491::g.64581::m.64581
MDAAEVARAVQRELAGVRSQLAAERAASEGLKAQRDEWLERVEWSLQQSQEALQKVQEQNLSLKKKQAAVAHHGGSPRRGRVSFRDLEGSPLPSSASALAKQSWQRFMALLGDDLPEKEVFLVSLETLKSLMKHYGLTDPIEAARVE